MKEKDMHMPAWLCVFGCVLSAGALACLVLCFVVSVYALIGFALCLCLGVAAILCYKNQWVEMIDDNEFIYSTMFGNETKYYFSDIESLKQNADSMTLHLKNGKIHIESCAVISERFANAINSKL